jgi:hypothetical protein
MVAAAGALEMTGGQRAELERLARSHTVPARDVRQAKAFVVGRGWCFERRDLSSVRVHAEVCPSVA